MAEPGAAPDQGRGDEVAPPVAGLLQDGGGD